MNSANTPKETSSARNALGALDPEQEQIRLVAAYNEVRREVRNASIEARQGTTYPLVEEKLNTLSGLYEEVKKSFPEDIDMHITDFASLKEVGKLLCVTSEHGIRNSNVLHLDHLIKGTHQVFRETYATQHDIFVENLPDDFGDLVWRQSKAWCRRYFEIHFRQLFVQAALFEAKAFFNKRARVRNESLSSRQNAIPPAPSVLVDRVAMEVSLAEPHDEVLEIIEQLYSLLAEKNPDSWVNYYRFVLNPDSFLQSFENIRFLHCLLVAGRVVLHYDEDDEPFIQICNNRGKGKTATRFISLQLHYTMWQELIRKYAITESYNPHRSGDVDLDDYTEYPVPDYSGISPHRFSPASD